MPRASAACLIRLGISSCLRPLRPVGLGDQRRDVVAGLDQVLEGRQGEVAGAQEDQPDRWCHGRSSLTLEVGRERHSISRP